GTGSQIDDIWVSSQILLDVEVPELINAIGITDSDHRILTTNVWANAVQQAANRYIPKTYTAPKTFHALSLKASRLHTAFTHINKCLHILAKAAPPLSMISIIQRANKHLSRALTAAQIPKFSITPLILIAEDENGPD
ncbi:1216_t:CDS:2, partial [Gigaspora rosea]